MNRDRAKELLPIIQAFAEGKEIECSDKGKNTWGVAFNPTWIDNRDYRIKSEPKYRPFENSVECWKEMQKHEPLGWVISKDIQRCRFIPGIGSSGIYDELEILVGNTWYSFDLIFEEYTFADGTPFGVKVDEYVMKKPYER